MDFLSKDILSPFSLALRPRSFVYFITHVQHEMKDDNFRFVVTILINLARFLYRACLLANVFALFS